MRWVVLCHPAAGHVRPLLPLMAELVARGAQVECFATEPFRPWIEATGSTYHAYGEHAWFERGLGEGGLCGGMDALLETSQAMLPGLWERVRGLAPDAVAYEAHALWGKLLVQRLERPSVALCAMFAVHERALSARQLLDHVYGPGGAPGARAGLDALRRYARRARELERLFEVQCPDVLGYLGVAEALSIVFTARELQPEADAFGPEFAFVGAEAGAEAEAVTWRRRADRSRVLIAMGTMYNDAPEFYRSCYAALRDLPVDVMLATGRRLRVGDVPPVPENFQVVAELPQRALLPQAELFLTHGGINSAHEAMLAGVGMVVLPSQADHHIVARQVESAGAGMVLPRAMAGPERLRAAVIEALSRPELRTRSAGLGERLRAGGGARRAATLMEEFVADRTRRTMTCCTHS